MSRSQLLRAAGVLLLIELFSFGFCLRRMGFYHDDWPLLEQLLAGGGYLATVRRLLDAGWLVRPVSALWLPILGQLAGPSPLPYHIAALAANGLAAIAFFGWMARLTGDPRLALLGAALATVFPNHPATHHWLTNIAQPVAEALVFCALWAHLGWLETRDRRRGAAPGVLYLAAFLSYESIAFLPLAGAVASYERSRRAGATPRAALRTLPGDLLPFLPGFLAGIAWQWGVASSLQGKQVALSLAWMATVAKGALLCLTSEPFALTVRTFRFFFMVADDAALLLLALFVAAAGWLLADDGASDGGKALPIRVILACAAAIIVAGYLPFALSGQYYPQVAGTMSRVNAVGSWAAGLLLGAALLWPWERFAKPGSGWGRPGRAATIAVALAPLTWNNWYIARQWAGSWEQQVEVLARLVPWAPKIPPGSTLILRGVPQFYNGTEVFYEQWGFQAAFRLKTGRADIRTFVPRGQLVGTPQAVLEVYEGKTTATFPYKDLYQYDAQADKVIRVVP